jgi:hypothetical protein
MESPVTARHSPVTADLRAASLVPGCQVPSTPGEGAKPAAVITANCAVCGVEFTASRPTARCCSGRCRIALSRTRRVADLVQRLAAAEAALCVAEKAVNDAGAALRDLRALAEQGGAKVAP